jgi:hypothetical protein
MREFIIDMQMGAGKGISHSFQHISEECPAEFMQESVNCLEDAWRSAEALPGKMMALLGALVNGKEIKSDVQWKKDLKHVIVFEIDGSLRFKVINIRSSKLAMFEAVLAKNDLTWQIASAFKSMKEGDSNPEKQLGLAVELRKNIGDAQAMELAAQYKRQKEEISHTMMQLGMCHLLNNVAGVPLTPFELIDQLLANSFSYSEFNVKKVAKVAMPNRCSTCHEHQRDCECDERDVDEEDDDEEG